MTVGAHISPEKKAEIARDLLSGLSIIATAKKHGSARSTVRRILAEIGGPVASREDWREQVADFVAFRHSQTLDADGNLTSESVALKPPPGEEFKPPSGHAIKGVSALLDPQGRVVQQWVKTREDQVDPVELARAIREVFAEAGPPPVIPPPTQCISTLFTAYPVPDLHMGMRADFDDTGNAYDYDIAEERVGGAIDRVVGLAPPSKTALLVLMGDNTHTNDRTNMTPRSRHVMDTAGRHRVTQKRGLRLIRRMAERLAEKHERVIIRALEGNHDEDAAGALELALACVYEGSERIEVVEDGRPVFYFRRGASFTAWSHGHLTPPDRMPMTMAEDCPEDWARSEFRYCFHGHFHRKMKGQVGGSVEVEGLPPVCARDAYGHGIGGRTKPSLSALSFCEVDGLVARNVVPLRYPSVGAPRA